MVIPRLGFGFHKKGQAIVAVFRTNVKLPFDVAEVDTVAAVAAADGRVLHIICWKAPEQNPAVLSIPRSFRAASVTVQAVMEPSRTHDSLTSWNQFKGLRKARADSCSTKVAAIGRQDSVNAPSFSNCGNGAINQAEVEPCESCIQFHGSGNVGRKRWFILVSRSWIEDMRDQPSHGSTVVSEKVVNLG